MAFLAKTLSFLFLIVLISSLKIQARESKFFQKFTLISTKNKVIPESIISQAPTPAPSPEPAEAPAHFYAETGSGYGLYGRDSFKFPLTNPENELLNEQLSDTGYQNNNNKHGYTSNGYVTEKQEMGDTRYMQNYQSSNRGYNGNNYNTNGYENEKQGMSDTRFLENGKYYHDVKNDESTYYANGFESNKGYYGNTQNVNAFNTMEEFENQQEYHQERPEEYVP